MMSWTAKRDALPGVAIHFAVKMWEMLAFGR